MKTLVTLITLTSVLLPNLALTAQNKLDTIEADGSTLTLDGAFTFSIPEGFIWKKEAMADDALGGFEFVHWIGTRSMHNETVALMILGIELKEIPEAERIEFISGFLSGINKAASRNMRTRGFKIQSIESKTINDRDLVSINTKRVFTKPDKIMFSYSRVYLASKLYYVGYYGVSAEEPEWVIESATKLIEQLNN